MLRLSCQVHYTTMNCHRLARSWKIQSSQENMKIKYYIVKVIVFIIVIVKLEWLLWVILETISVCECLSVCSYFVAWIFYLFTVLCFYLYEPNILEFFAAANGKFPMNSTIKTSLKVMNSRFIFMLEYSFLHTQITKINNSRKLLSTYYWLLNKNSSNSISASHHQQRHSYIKYHRFLHDKYPLLIEYISSPSCETIYPCDTPLQGKFNTFIYLALIYPKF